MAGEFKRTVTLLGENTDQGRRKFQEEIEEAHTLFKQFVKAHRPQVDLERVATGEHWYGAKALECQLVDELRTSDDVLLDASAGADLYGGPISAKAVAGAAIRPYQRSAGAVLGIS